MKTLEIRKRMMWATLLPVTLLTVMLTVVFLMVRVDDVGQAHSQRARSLARQLAVASEYGLFSVNISHLKTVANGAMREPDVRSVIIVDNKGQILVQSGKPTYTTYPALTRFETEQLDPDKNTDFWVQPINASQIKLNDLFEVAGFSPDPQLNPMGHVLIELSRDTLLARERDILWVGLAIAFGLLLFGGFLALRLGQGVIRPILRVSHTIERIRNGDLSARAQVLPKDPLAELQLGLNQMAENLESGRDQLERRITSATLELRAKKEEAETATLAKSRFLAAASHDLRQPTHALGMFVARLAQLPHDGQTQTLIGNLEASVRAMQDLLDGLLDISRLDAQSVPVQLRPFALADLFEKLRVGLSESAQDKGLCLRIRPTDVWLMSDPSLLHRVLQNLLGNALRYTQQGSVLLACRVADDGKHVRIEVWDSGIGIAPENHQAIFKEFYQVGNSERDRGKGMGLGLNIVERTIRLLGHPLQLRSSLGSGTRFSLRVPLAPVGSDLALQSMSQITSFNDPAGQVILVVEDDALAREGLVGLLASWGYRVGAAAGLKAALKQLGQGLLPDVIVSDYRLRDGEIGIDTIRQLRTAIGRTVPACLMSGDTDAGLMQAAKEAGLTLLHKPVRPAKLRNLVRHLASETQTDGVILV